MGAATATVLVLLAWFGTTRPVCVRSPVATATCRALLCSVCSPIPRTEIKGTSVWIAFSYGGKKESASGCNTLLSAKAQSLFKKLSNVFQTYGTHESLLECLQAMFALHDYLGSTVSESGVAVVK